MRCSQNSFVAPESMAWNHTAVLRRGQLHPCCLLKTISSSSKHSHERGCSDNPRDQRGDQWQPDPGTFSALFSGTSASSLPGYPNCSDWGHAQGVWQLPPGLQNPIAFPWNQGMWTRGEGKKRHTELPPRQSYDMDMAHTVLRSSEVLAPSIHSLDL